MQIKIINYRAISSPLVMAFVDIELNGWLRFIGLNLMRDDSLRAAQLKTRSGSREGWLYFPAVVIPDDDLRKLLISEILAAIHAHVETLPPERRMKPARLPEPKPPVNAEPKPRPPAAKPSNGKKALAPPRRLLIGATKGGRT
jgi:hypothetical protein